MASQLEGVAVLTKQLQELGEPKTTASVLRTAVKSGLQEVEHRARSNLAAISPGKALSHRTYKGRIVSRGFALGSLATRFSTSRDKQKVSGVLGVLTEAFYALQFFELGTARIPKQPWLVPAFESSQDPALQAIADAMRKRIERIARKRAAGK